MNHGSKTLRILSLLGQRPDSTGSGVFVRSIWRYARKCGDLQRLIIAGYPEDDERSEFQTDCDVITFTRPGGVGGDLSFPILGMSDIMPYCSQCYGGSTDEQVRAMINAFREHAQRQVANFQPEIIQINHLWVLLALCPEFRSIPCFVTVHGTGLKLLTTAPRFRHYVVSGIDAVRHFFCVSRDIADDAMAEYQLPASKVSVVGNGYDPMYLVQE